jgi:glycine dehydrogenase
MLETLGIESLEELMQQVIPDNIRLSEDLSLESADGESGTLSKLRAIADHNQVFRSYIGLGYYNSITPGVIQRNILEDPGWYTQYTPYQAEIAQGRLEALMNFQTMASELTGLPFSNASLLDEATAAAEAMSMCWAITRRKKNGFFVASDCHPQTIAVVETRAKPLGIEVHVGSPRDIDFDAMDLFGVLVQYPTTDGRIEDYTDLANRAHESDALIVAATDLLALTLLKPPAEFGADISIGSSQRFGVPLGFGGPHAAFLTTLTEYERFIPGRVVGLSKDDEGGHAFRLARQTREQHIRREKATSNICTAQVLLAVMASMYAVYHGPVGLRNIALQVRAMTDLLAKGLRRLGFDIGEGVYFDTLKVRLEPGKETEIITAARSRCINLRQYEDGAVGVSLDQTVTRADLEDLFLIFSRSHEIPFSIDDLIPEVEPELPQLFARTSTYLQQRVFHRFHAEHEMLRYIQKLRERDLSLAFSMIPLGSCTMKLNASSEMFPISWPEFAHLHPFAPIEQTRGYSTLFEQLESWLGEITGLRAVSLQPNAGSQGELTGLLVIRAYHEARGEGHRNICLVPQLGDGRLQSCPGQE